MKRSPISSLAFTLLVAKAVHRVANLAGVTEMEAA
jgi:hypothetical protein